MTNLFNYPKIEPTCIKDAPSLKILEINSDLKSLEYNTEINKILDFIDYEKLEPSKNDTKNLEIIKFYIKKLQQDLSIKENINLDELINKSKEIDMYKEIEKECDILEISLANLKVEYDEYKLLKKTNIKDLENEFTKLNQEFNDKQFEIKNKNILDQAYAFLNQEPVNKNILNIFSYIKNRKDYELIVEKYELIQNIKKKENGILGQIFLSLTNKGYLNLEEMEKDFKIDKILILKIIYGMTNNGIVIYDKEKGEVYLRK